MFPCEFCEIFKNTFFIEHLRWLLLDTHISVKPWNFLFFYSSPSKLIIRKPTSPGTIWVCFWKAFLFKVFYMHTYNTHTRIYWQLLKKTLMENFIFCARLALSASMKPFVQNQCCQQQDWFPKIATTDLVSSRLNSGLRKVFHRGSRSHMFFKIGVLINFAIFTGKHRRWTLFLIKLQFFRPAILWKRDSSIGVFLWILWYF